MGNIFLSNPIQSQEAPPPRNWLEDAGLIDIIISGDFSDDHNLTVIFMQLHVSHLFHKSGVLITPVRNPRARLLSTVLFTYAFLQRKISPKGKNYYMTMEKRPGMSSSPAHGYDSDISIPPKQ